MTIKNKKTAVMLTAIAVTATLAVTMALVATAPQASASHNSEPTMWVNGIDPNQTHTYIYQVNSASLDNLNFALMVKEFEAKPHVQLQVTDPVGVVTICPFTPATNTLLVAECNFQPPNIPVGIWQVSISAGPGLPFPPVGYAISADGHPP